MKATLAKYAPAPERSTFAETTFNDYLLYATKFIRFFTDWRMGQAYYNALIDLRPDLAAKVKGTYADAYENDAHMPQFLNFVFLNWSK